MKLIFTLVVLLFSLVKNIANAQVNSLRVKNTPEISVSSTEQVKASEVNVRFRCGARVSTVSEEPLIVIDGIPHELSELKKLNPNDIVSINILTNAAASAIYGCRAANGVIIITTKTALVRKFIIKDFLNGEKIPSATIYFTSRSDTIMAAANESGILVIDRLKPGVEYEMTVSSAGYKTASIIAKGKEQQVLLQRDVKECGSVVIVSNEHLRSISCGGSFTIIKTAKSKNNDKPPISSVYPNPVRRNNTFNLEFESEQDERMQLAVISLNGNIVLLQSQKISRGLNRLSVIADPKWAAGIYNIQLRNEKGTLVSQEKLVVQ